MSTPQTSEDAADRSVQVTVNGSPRTVRAATVDALLEELGVDRRAVAVERNRELVRRGEFETTQLADGDEFEVVSFVGGG